MSNVRATARSIVSARLLWNYILKHLVQGTIRTFKRRLIFRLASFFGWMRGSFSKPRNIGIYSYATVVSSIPRRVRLFRCIVEKLRK